MSIIDVLLGPLRDSLRSVIDGQVSYIQTIVMARPKGLSVLQEVLFGMSWGYAEVTALYVVILTLFLAMFRRQYFQSFGQAMLLLVTVVTFGFAWFSIGTGLQAAESYLTERANFFTPPDTGSETIFVIPGFNNPMWDILTILNLSGAMLPITWMYSIFDALRMLVFFLLPIALVLTPLGQRSKKFFQIVLATALLTMLFGRPVGALAMELGQWARYQLGAVNNSWATLTFTLLSIALVYVFVIITAIVCYKSPEIFNSLVRGSAEVSGDVTAKLAPGQKIDADTVRMELNNAMPMPVTIVESRTDTRSMITNVRDRVIDGAALAAVTIATTRGGATAGHITKAITDSAKETLKSPPPPE